MPSDEAKEYMDAALQAIVDAEEEDMRNRNDNSQPEEVIEVEDVPFITVENKSNRRNKRKASADAEGDDRDRENTITTPESVRRAVSNIHTKIGYPPQNVMDDENDSETNVTVD